MEPGLGIAHAAGCHSHPAGINFASILTDYTPDPGFVKEQLFCLPLPEFGAAALYIPVQGIDNVRCPVTHRKDPVSALSLERDAESFKKRHGVRCTEPVDGTVQEPGIAPHRLEKGVLITVVGDIAAAFSGDKQLAAHLVILLQQQHRKSLFRRCSRAEHSRGSGADHHQVIFPFHQTIFSSFFSYTSYSSQIFSSWA